MTAKEWLRRGRNLEKLLETLEESKAKAWAKATSATASIKAAPTGSGNKNGNKADHYLSFCECIVNEQQKLVQIKKEIISATAQMNDDALRALIIEYYVNGKSWKEVAENLRYNECYVRGRMHARALRAITPIIESCNTKQQKDVL